jgi:sugar phosphate isomerase/epimerase
MLRLGFVSAILPDYSLEKLVSFAASEQFSCLEIMCWPVGKSDRRYAGVTHIDVLGLNTAKIKEIKALFKDYGVGISGLGYYPNPLDEHTEKRKFFQDHLKKVIIAADSLEIPVVNTFIGRNQFLNLDENFELFKTEWAPILNIAETHGIKIGIENCPMIFTYDEWPGGKNMAINPHIWERMFDFFPSPLFGLNFDPSHFIWQQMDYIQPLYDFCERIHHIHLKDVKIYKNKLDKVGIMSPPNQYSSPKIPGFGDVNWNKFFSALTDIGYRGPVCIEVEDKAFEGSEQDVVSAIKTARNYLNQFIS